MNRRTFIQQVGSVAGVLAVTSNVGRALAGSAAGKSMLASESPASTAPSGPILQARPGEGGLQIEGFDPANIVALKDGSLMTEGGWQSADRGRSWSRSQTFKMPPGMPESLGLVRLPNGELGTYYADQSSLETALGNETNNWFFRWSADEGKTWSPPMKITLDGLTLGLKGTIKVLSSGRIILATYSQFIGSGFSKRGRSMGSYRGHPFDVETEGHFPASEACRVYYSDDNGRHWQASDGWIMGWRQKQVITDTFTEGDAVELADGRILMIGRSLTGRLYQAFSPDKGHSWWPGAGPTELMSSYSPARICRLPKSGDLMVLWNQVSREEIRKGLRRSRLSTAVSNDGGKSWHHFKNLEAIDSLAGVSKVPTDPDISPVVGDDQVGAVPEDYAIFHYPSISAVGDEVFISYATDRFSVGANGDVQAIPGSVTRILPEEWFYSGNR